jgi:hypothetical protein
MIRNRLYRFIMLAAGGGMVFQATAGCDTVMDTLTAELVPALLTALTTAIVGGATA